VKWLLEPDHNAQRVVHKVEITNGTEPNGTGFTEVEMPVHSKILWAEYQMTPGVWGVWYETDLDLIEDRVTVRFEWFSTGKLITGPQAEYVCTQRAYSGKFMIHLYWWVL